MSSGAQSDSSCGDKEGVELCTSLVVEYKSGTAGCSCWRFAEGWRSWFLAAADGQVEMRGVQGGRDTELPTHPSLLHCPPPTQVAGSAAGGTHEGPAERLRPGRMARRGAYSSDSGPGS